MNKNEVRCNIIKNSEVKAIIEEVLATVCDSLSLSLGPSGSTTIMQNQALGHVVTKDGFNIIKSLRYNEPVRQTILNILQNISTELVLKVGDGSTSCMIAARYIYSELSKAIVDLKARPKELLDMLNAVIIELNDIIKTKIAKPISEDCREIKNIAAVSLNNDKKLGELISEIYIEGGQEAFINIDMNGGTESKYEKAGGFIIDAGYFDKILVNNSNDTCRLFNAKILMLDSIVTEVGMALILEAIKAVIAPNGINRLVVIAPAYSDEALSFFRDIVTYGAQKGFDVKGRINIIKFSTATEHDKNTFYDMAKKVGANIILTSLGHKPDEGTIDKYLGSADQVVSSYRNTTIYGSHGNTDEVELHIGNLKNELIQLDEKNDTTFDKRYELKKRIAVMEDKLYVIHVGGNSDMEKVTNKYLLEDAVAACKSALTHGYVIGGNLSIPMAIEMHPLTKCDEMNEKDMVKLTILKALREAFKDVFTCLCKNKYNLDEDIPAIHQKFESCVKTHHAYDLTNDSYTTNVVINSAETEYEILKNVISIISLLLTSNQFITINPETLVIDL